MVENILNYYLPMPSRRKHGSVITCVDVSPPPNAFIGLRVASFIAKQHSTSPTDFTCRASLLLGTFID
jgi:hypothetical protein